MLSVRRDLQASKVIPIWPKVGEACVCPMADHIDSPLREQVLDPNSCILPEAEWPDETPQSKVYATDAEWYPSVKGAHERNMFVPIADERIFRNQFGEKVLNGAMGVDKPKEVDGKTEMFLRFICILTACNRYLRKMEGDSWSIPQASLLNSVILGEDEYFVQDGADLQSCFNLFSLPDAWLGHFVFSKTVDQSAFGLTPGTQTYVAIRAVPMGWVNSVDLIQNFIRKILLGICKVCPDFEVNRDNRVISSSVIVVCMDGFDFLHG